MAELVEKLGVEMQADLPQPQPGSGAAPAAAPRPAFPPKLPGVTDEDWRVYRTLCETTVLADHDLLRGEVVWQDAARQGLGEEQFGESLTVLEAKSLVKLNRVMDRRHIPYAVTVTQRGLELFFAHAMAEYQAARKRVAGALLDGASSGQAIVAATGLSRLFVHHTLKDFESRRWIADVFWTGGDGIVAIGTPVHLKRFVGG
jgi:hypothetical protein